MIQSIEKRNIVDEVYDQMKKMIENGDWLSGEKIPSENVLSERFNVSRNTVRSAIQKLKGIGILTTRQGQGTFVCESVVDNIISHIIPASFLSKKEIIEIMQFRKGLEIESAALAASRHDDEDIKGIKKALDEMVDNLSDYKKHALADYKYHLAIAKASGNRIIYRAIVSLKNVIYSHFETMSKDLGTELSIEMHKKIYQAIESGDSELVKDLVRRNIEKSIEILKEES